MSVRPSKVDAARAARTDGPHLEVVRRRSRSLIKRSAGTRFAPVAIAVGICIATVVAGVLIEQVVLAQSAFRLATINRHMAEVSERHQALVLEATKLESPGRIERYARTRLGMVDPTNVEYIVADLNRPKLGRLASSKPPRLPPPATGAAAAFSPSLAEGSP